MIIIRLKKETNNHFGGARATLFRLQQLSPKLDDNLMKRFSEKMTGSDNFLLYSTLYKAGICLLISTVDNMGIIRRRIQRRFQKYKLTSVRKCT
jgi:hypothetical protein